MLVFKMVRNIFRHLLALYIVYHVLGTFERIKINCSHYWVAFYTVHPVLH